MQLRDAEMHASAMTNSTQRAIGEYQRMLGNNPQGDNAPSARRELARLQGLMPDYQARHKAIAALNARVASFLSRLPANIELAEAKVKIKLAQGDTHLKAVTQIRGKIMGLIGSRSQVERAVPTNKEAKAMAADYVQSLARRITPRLVIEHGDKFNLSFGGDRDQPSPVEVLALVDPKAVLAKLHEMIDGRDTSAAQMSATDRKVRLNEITAELLELERREQAHIDAAKADGTVIEQRVNVDVRALIGLLVLGEQSKAA